MKQIEILVNKNEEKVVPFIWVNNTKENEITVNARMVGENSSLHLVGLFFGNATNAVVFNTIVFHEAPKTKSRTTIRAVFQDRASFANDGMITIQKGAKGADGYFASKLLLFDDAKGRSVPSLEIDENDLKAGHSSTIGRPDPQQLFYLQSRGLSEKEAIRLIMTGFFDPVMGLLPEKEKMNAKKKLKPFINNIDPE